MADHSAGQPGLDERVVGLGPVRRAPLYEEVADSLLAFISEQDLQPGDRLVGERDLAAALHVSRSSVRQALTVLRVMGIVDIRHGDGIRLARAVDDVVPPIDAQVLRDHPDLPLVNEIREGLESHAARLAARRRSASDLRAMSAATKEMGREIDRGEIGTLGDSAFHAAVLAAAGNALLTDLLEGISDTVARVARASLARPGQPPRSLETHELILEAIRGGDADEAARLMLDHLVITGAVEGDA